MRRVLPRLTALDLEVLFAALFSLADRVPVPAACLVRVSRAAKPVGAADAGRAQTRPIPPQPATTQSGARRRDSAGGSAGSASSRGTYRCSSVSKRRRAGSE
jgi:hypothetical protein